MSTIGDPGNTASANRGRSIEFTVVGKGGKKKEITDKDIIKCFGSKSFLGRKFNRLLLGVKLLGFKKGIRVNIEKLLANKCYNMLETIGMKFEDAMKIRLLELGKRKRPYHVKSEKKRKPYFFKKITKPGSSDSKEISISKTSKEKKVERANKKFSKIINSEMQKKEKEASWKAEIPIKSDEDMMKLLRARYPELEEDEEDLLEALRIDIRGSVKKGELAPDASFDDLKNYLGASDVKTEERKPDVKTEED